MAKPPPKDEGPKYVSKKCHECYVYVPLDAEVCPSCKAKLGKVSKHGMAERVTDWKSYAGFAVALLILLIFIKIAFL